MCVVSWPSKFWRQSAWLERRKPLHLIRLMPRRFLRMTAPCSCLVVTIVVVRGSAQGEDYLAWPVKPLQMRYAFRINENPITSPQEIKLSKIECISIEIVRRKTAFTDIIQSVLNYVRSFWEDYVVSLIDMPVLNIINYMISLIFLATSSKSTYARYIPATKVIIKKDGTLPLLVSLSIQAPVLKMQGITHFDDSSLHTFTEDGILVMVQVANTFVKTT